MQGRRHPRHSGPPRGSGLHVHCDPIWYLVSSDDSEWGIRIRVSKVFDFKLDKSQAATETHRCVRSRGWMTPFRNCIQWVHAV
jgi:hypothetical protein